MEQELSWVKAVLAEFGYVGPLTETCCPLREMLSATELKGNEK